MIVARLGPWVLEALLVRRARQEQLVQQAKLVLPAREVPQDHRGQPEREVRQDRMAIQDPRVPKDLVEILMLKGRIVGGRRSKGRRAKGRE